MNANRTPDSALLAIECIGDDADQMLRGFARAYGDLGRAIVGQIPANQYCAMVVGWDRKYKYRREFLRAQKDYSNANSKGSRGVMAYYILEPGILYQVKQPISWKRTDTYFCRVQRGRIVRFPERGVDRWLRHLWVSMSTMEPPIELPGFLIPFHESM